MKTEHKKVIFEDGELRHEVIVDFNEKINIERYIKPVMIACIYELALDFKGKVSQKQFISEIFCNKYDVSKEIGNAYFNDLIHSEKIAIESSRDLAHHLLNAYQIKATYIKYYLSLTRNLRNLIGPYRLFDEVDGFEGTEQRGIKTGKDVEISCGDITNQKPVPRVRPHTNPAVLCGEAYKRYREGIDTITRSEIRQLAKNWNLNKTSFECMISSYINKGFFKKGAGRGRLIILESIKMKTLEALNNAINVSGLQLTPEFHMFLTELTAWAKACQKEANDPEVSYKDFTTPSEEAPEEDSFNIDDEHSYDIHTEECECVTDPIYPDSVDFGDDIGCQTVKKMIEVFKERGTMILARDFDHYTDCKIKGINYYGFSTFGGFWFKDSMFITFLNDFEICEYGEMFISWLKKNNYLIPSPLNSYIILDKSAIRKHV